MAPPTKPIDARQHIWWHRLRRMGPLGFVVGGGGLLAPLITCLLFGGVILYFRYPWSAFVRNGALIWTVTAPIYIGACFWTWKHMEKRYRATLAVSCPWCGYSRRGGTGTGRCSECGKAVDVSRPVP